MKGAVRGVGENISGVDAARSRLLHKDELLSSSTAAAIAGRSVRTIRRAYLAGTLLAYRDGAGRGVRIRYGDLLDWMMRKPVTSPGAGDPSRVPEAPIGAPHTRKRKPSDGPSENLALLNAARRRRLNGRGRAVAVAGHAEETPASQRA